MIEDKRAFPYKPPSKKMQERYSWIFTLKKAPRERISKLLFDKIAALIAIFLLWPIFVIILIAYVIEGFIHHEHKGSIFFSYIASSRGKKFKKYKFRLVKETLIDKNLRSQGDWRAHPSERQPQNLTCIGKILKKYYLDELPQVFNIIKGDISFVGPRALAWHHYQRDIKQGNIVRKLLKAGIFSESHTRKGTRLFGKPQLEYEYIEKYMKLSCWQLLWTDFKIISRGIKMILEGKGY